MKTSLFFALACFTNFTSNSQVATLEHSYNTNIVSDPKAQYVVVTSSGIKYYTFNNTNKTLSIYNSSHQFEQIVNLPIGLNLNVEWVVATDKLFNSDDSLEFLIRNSQNGSSVILVGENGSVLQDFGDFYDAWFYKYNNSYKMVLKGSDDPTIMNVYSLSGTLSVDQQYLLSKNILFPNPTNNEINITGEFVSGQKIEIFNLNGQKVMEIPVSQDSEMLSIDVSQLQTGSYLYKTGNQTKKFIKN